MINIVYSYNKYGFEDEYWQREISAASNDSWCYIPFNHGLYLDPNRYLRAQLLDDLYYEKNRDLMRMYDELENLLYKYDADVLFVDNCFPYHPEMLKKLSVYKAMRTTDGPITAYDRDFAYLHAYDHVFYHTPAYSRDLTMPEKLHYCGVKKSTFLPLGSFDALCNRATLPENISSQQRDIDVIFIGALHLNKMPFISSVMKRLGSKLKIYGVGGVKRNIYFNIKYGFPGWVSPIEYSDYVGYYQRSKIGINIHNRGMYSIGNYRLFDLPANGVMQITDGGHYINEFFTVGKEIESYNNVEHLVEKVDYYLSHDRERNDISSAAMSRVKSEYTISEILNRLGFELTKSYSA